MRNNQQTEHTQHTKEELLEEIFSCGIFYIAHDIEMNEDEFEVSNGFIADDPLILTREELKELGQAIIELAEEGCDHCEE